MEASLIYRMEPKTIRKKIKKNKIQKLGVDGKPVEECFRPDARKCVRTHAQTDGQTETIMPPGPSMHRVK